MSESLTFLSSIEYKKKLNRNNKLTCWTDQEKVLEAMAQQRIAPHCPEQHQYWCWPE